MDTVLLKYHSLGNDYLVYDTCKNNIKLDSKAVRMICARNFGLGSEGILAGPLMDGQHVEMKIFRPDGSEDGVSRDEAQIFFRYLKDAGYLEHQKLLLRTREGEVWAEEEASSKMQSAAPVGKLFLSEEFICKNHLGNNN